MAVPRPSNIPGFHYIILDANELESHQCLVPIAELLNGAFFRNKDTKQRVPHPSYLTGAIGVHGRCCVMFRSEDVNGDDINMTRPVATALLKYFNPNLGFQPLEVDGNQVGDIVARGYDHEPEDILSIHHWEPSCVAVLASDPSLKGIGLAIECVNQTEYDLLDRLEQAKKSQPQPHANGSISNGTKEDIHPNPNASFPALIFWIRTTADLTGPYWQRRGYDTVDLTWYPKGRWGKMEDFQIMTLKKDVQRRVN